MFHTLYSSNTTFIICMPITSHFRVCSCDQLVEDVEASLSLILANHTRLITEKQHKLTVLAHPLCQSQVEIKHYSVVYFNCITMFEALLHKTSVKGGAHMHCVNVLQTQ